MVGDERSFHQQFHNTNLTLSMKEAIKFGIITLNIVDTFYFKVFDNLVPKLFIEYHLDSLESN